MKIIGLLALLFYFLEAHQTGLSYLQIKEDSNKNIALIYKKPLEDSQAKDINILYPSQCQKSTDNLHIIENGFIIEKFSLWCGEAGLMDSRIWVEGLVTSDKGIVIHYENDLIVEKALLRSSTPFMLIDKQYSKFQLFTEYFELGIIHILLGFDHLLFVLSMILLVSNKKVLLYAVTAFTLSHSLSLALSIFGIVTVAPLYVEAMIALSIVFLARELLVYQENSFTKNHLGYIAFIFGLLHGLGFSNLLSSIGLPKDEIPWTLFSFNIGIEMGQLVFIFFVGTIFFILKKYILNFIHNIKTITAYLIGIIATFWLIERIIAF